MGQKKDLAICIPTYNRAEQVKDYLEKTEAILNELSIDVYFYDSSDNDDTKEVLEYYQKRNLFLFYVRVDSSIPSNIKIMNIWGDENLMKNYRYIWIMGDSLRWTDSVYRRVVAQLNNKYQAIIPDPYDFNNIGTCVMNDKQEVLDNCCVSLTLYGCSILSTDYFIGGTNWEKIKKKYCDKNHLGFSQVGYFFERLNEIEDLRVLILCCFFDAGALNSKIRKDNHWTKTSFYNTFLVQWKNTVKDLPSSYKHKNEAIKMYDNNIHFISLPRLEQMRVDNTYGLGAFFKYFFKWRSCTDFSLWTLFQAAVIPPEKITKMHETWTDSLNKRTQVVNERMYEFASRFGEVSIYGAGDIAKKKADFLIDRGINISCLFVSEPVQEENYKGIPITVYDESYIKNNTTGIIMGMGVSNSKQVLMDYFLNYDIDHVFSEHPYGKDRIVCLTDYMRDYIDGRF